MRPTSHLPAGMNTVLVCDCFSCSVGTLHGHVLHHCDNHIGRSLLQQNCWPTSLSPYSNSFLSFSSANPQLLASLYSVVYFFPHSHYLAISQQKPVATGSIFISLQTGCRADFREGGMLKTAASVSSERKNMH